MEFLHEEHRFYLNDERGNLIAEVTFVKTGEHLYIIDHTFVDTSLKGQGVGAELIKKVIDKARSEGKKIIPLCPFAAKEFQKHKEYADVLEK